MSASVADPVIVLMAAGAGQRFGGAKQLAEIAGEAMCRRVARQLLALDCPLVAVTGAHADAVEQALADLPLETLRHADWEHGLGSSIACGARHVRQRHGGASGMLVCLADQPLIDTSHYRRMLIRHGEIPDHLLASSHGTVTGPPVLFPADCLLELADWRDGRGAHALLEREARRLECIEVSDPDDVDTPEDLRQVREAWSRRRHP